MDDIDYQRPMRFRVLEEVVMLVSKIMLKEVDIDKTIEDVKNGKTAITKGNPEVMLDKSGKYKLMDGKHRIAAQILEGKKKIKVNIIEIEYV